MVSRRLETLKKLVQIGEELEQRLLELEKIEATISTLEKYVRCDSEPCQLYTRYIVECLGDLLRLYEALEAADPGKVFSEVPLPWQVEIDMANMVVEELFHPRCGWIDVNIPLRRLMDKSEAEKVREELLARVRDRIRSEVESLPQSYIRALLSVAAILDNMDRTIRWLQRQYESLARRLDELAGGGDE